MLLTSDGGACSFLPSLPWMRERRHPKELRGAAGIEAEQCNRGMDHGLVWVGSSELSLELSSVPWAGTPVQPGLEHLPTPIQLKQVL